MQIKSIIFDFGGVLIDWNPAYLYRKIFDNEAEMQFFFEEICTSDWNEEQDAGRSLYEATMERIEKFPLYELEIRAFYGRWTEMLGGPIHQNIDLLERIKTHGGYRLFGLTNWSAETYPYAQIRYAFLSYFEDIVVSGRENMRKPNPKIYQLLLERNHLQAQECLFLDDNLRNVKAARKLGIEAIHVRTPYQLLQDCIDRGIL